MLLPSSDDVEPSVKMGEYQQESASALVSSVSEWVQRLTEGDAEAAQQLWDRYFGKVLECAEQRIRNCPPGVISAEEIAASVFESIWRGAQEGRFDRVQNRDELWWLLLALTRRKAASHIRRETAQKRGGATHTQSLSGSNGKAIFESLVCDEPTPEYLIAMEEEYERLLTILRDEKSRRIAVLKLEGYSNNEICEELDIAPATVARKVRLIRDTWARELEK